MEESGVEDHHSQCRKVKHCFLSDGAPQGSVHQKKKKNLQIVYNGATTCKFCSRKFVKLHVSYILAQKPANFQVSPAKLSIRHR